MANHMSELCIKGDLTALNTYLVSNMAVKKPDGTLEVDQIGSGTVEEALQHAANRVDDEGRTPLHWALSVKASATVLEALLAPPYNSSPLTVDIDGVTPLMTAASADVPRATLQSVIDAAKGFLGASTSATAAVSVFKDIEAYVNAQDKLGNTALIAAASRGNAKTVEVLLLNNASFSMTNRRGQTALHRAVSRGSTEAVDALISAARKVQQHRALLNAEDCEGNTPLHYASMENNQELGEMILRAGAIREKKNKEGKEFWQM